MSRSKSAPPKAPDEQVRETEIDSGFLGSRAPKDPTRFSSPGRGLAFSDHAVGPGTVGGMRTYYSL